MMKQLRNGEVKEGDEVYFMRMNGSFQKSKVMIVEKRGSYNRLHTSKIMKNGKVVKKVSTASEDEFYTYEY